MSQISSRFGYSISTGLCQLKVPATSTCRSSSVFLPFHSTASSYADTPLASPSFFSRRHHSFSVNGKRAHAPLRAAGATALSRDPPTYKDDSPTLRPRSKASGGESRHGSCASGSGSSSRTGEGSGKPQRGSYVGRDANPRVSLAAWESSGGGDRGSSKWSGPKARDRGGDGGSEEPQSKRHGGRYHSERRSENVETEFDGASSNRSRRRSPSSSSEATWAVIGVNQQLKDAKTCQQLLQMLQNAPQGSLTAVNIATAWVRLGNLQSKRMGRKDSSGERLGTLGAEDGDDMSDDGTSVAAVRQLLELTASAVSEMELRQIANTFWGIAKIEGGLLHAQRSREDASGPAGVSMNEVLQLLQQRIIGLSVPQPPRTARSSSSRGGVSISGGGNGEDAGRRASQLDVRDATQLWYSMAGLSQFPWSDALRSSLEEATLQAMEAAFLDKYRVKGTDAVEQRGGGGVSGGGGGWAETPTSVAQVVFRMAAVSGSRMIPDHKTRLAAVIDAMSYGEAALSHSASHLDNPDCLLVGAQLLRLDLSKEAVQRLHDLTLSLPPAAAARVGRTAMARALNSAVGLGLQPSASEARSWERLLLLEVHDGGDRWTSDALSWTMLALSGLKSYLPGSEARGQLLGVLRRVVRQLRANDASRVQNAMEIWGLQLPEREAALLRSKAGGSEGAAWSEHGARGGGSSSHAFRSWGVRR